MEHRLPQASDARPPTHVCEYLLCEYFLGEYSFCEYLLREYFLREYLLCEYLFEMEITVNGSSGPFHQKWEN